KLRAAGIACEVFLEPAKLAAQYQAAEKKGIPFVIVIEENGGLTLRDLSKRENREGLAVEEIATLLKAG
ncbi:MAG: histidine--tRNA ligase, partial [Spirochaetaceae bacterium]|nr:histidine--tRNA ligase [Spirochaetaceae bacterium]